MAETRGGGGGKNAKPKPKKTRVAAAVVSASPAVTTRAAASAEKAKNAASPAPKAKGKAKKPPVKATPVEATAVVVSTPAADSEAVPTRKKKKRKRVHKRKGSDASALASVESPEPPPKKQAVKKETQATPVKKAVEAAASVARPATQTQSVEGKSTRSRSKKKRGDTTEKEEETAKTEPRTALVDTPQRGRLTRAAAAAAAAQAALQTPQEPSAADQSPASALKSKTRKRRRSRQGRRDSVEPAPAVGEDDSKLEANDKPATETVDEADTAPNATLSPVKPKSTIISLRKVKGADRASEAENYASIAMPVKTSQSDEQKLEEEQEGEEEEDEEEDGDDDDEEVKAPPGLTAKSFPTVVSTDDGDRGEGESISAAEENVTDVAEPNDRDSLGGSALVDDLLGEQENQSFGDTSGDKYEDGDDGDAEQRERSDGVEPHETAECDEAIDELDGVEALPSAVEAGEDESVQLDPEESAVIDSEEIGDDEMAGEADDEIQRMEEELDEEQGGVEEDEEEETYEEPAHEDESDEEELSAAAMDMTALQQVDHASNAEDTDSDFDEQRGDERDHSESDSDAGYPAQEAVFSDSDEEEHRPGLGHHRFLSPPVESEGSSNGAPEVIELSDSDSNSEDDAESEGEPQLPSHPNILEAFSAHEHAGHYEEELEDDADEEDEDQEVDEQDDKELEKEDQEHAGSTNENREEEENTPSPTTYGATVYPESSGVSSLQAGEHVEIEESDDDEVDEGRDGDDWEQLVVSNAEHEGDEAEQDTQEEMEATEDDDSADDQAATHDNEGQEALESAEAPINNAPHVKDEILATLDGKLDESEVDMGPVTTPSKPEEPSEARDQEPTTSDASTAIKASEPARVIAYSSTPSKELLESVLAGSPRSTVASLTLDQPTSLLPVRSQPQSRSWGPSFGGASLDTSAPVAAASRPAEASPLSSWFFSKGPANFKKRVVMPRVKESSFYGAGSPRQRLGSPRPTKKARVDAVTEGEEKSATQDDLFAQTWSAQLLDPPLPAAMIKRLGGEKALALFSSSVTDLTPITLPTSEGVEVPSNGRLALSTLEEAIQEEKKRARAFDQELLQMLQGKTLTGKDLADEFAPLLVGITK